MKIMKAKLIYGGDETTETKEVELPQIPNVGDGFVVVLQKDGQRQSAHCVVKSVDYWIENGVFRSVEIWLEDEK